MDPKTATSFELLGKRWSALIVRDLVNGPQRFRELLAHLARINDKVLSQRLKELEEARVINRQVFAEVPIRVEYSLTEKGVGLVAVVQAMEQWDAVWAGGRTPGPVRPNGHANGHAAGHRSGSVAPATWLTGAADHSTVEPAIAAEALPHAGPLSTPRPAPALTSFVPVSA